MESTGLFLILIISFLIIIAFVVNFLATESKKRKAQSQEFNSLTEIKKFPNNEEAEIARSFLGANGIEAHVFSATGSAHPGLDFAQGGRLVVRKEDKEKALKLLEDLK